MFMKNLAVIKKSIYILILSFFGSYCCAQELDQQSSVAESLYSVVHSVSNYCYKVVSDVIGYVVTFFYDSKIDDTQDKSVQIQSILKGGYCTESSSEENCQFNNDFFNDTQLLGKLDRDNDQNVNMHALEQERGVLIENK